MQPVPRAANKVDIFVTQPRRTSGSGIAPIDAKAVYSQAIEGLAGAEACDKYMFVETYADWADHAKTLKLGAARQARQARSSLC